MTKEQMIKDIEYAIHYHEDQMYKIEQLLNCVAIENPTAIAKSQCKLGQWLYTEENHLLEILGEQFYNKMEQTHAQWHIEYIKIHKIFFPKEKKGFFASLVNSRKVDPLEVDKAKLYYTELQKTTTELLHALASSNRRVHAMNESKFF